MAASMLEHDQERERRRASKDWVPVEGERVALHTGGSEQASGVQPGAGNVVTRPASTASARIYGLREVLGTAHTALSQLDTPLQEMENPSATTSSAVDSVSSHRKGVTVYLRPFQGVASPLFSSLLDAVVSARPSPALSRV
eukprot:157378-Rhodomonas_salina.1